MKHSRPTALSAQAVLLPFSKTPNFKSEKEKEIQDMSFKKRKKAGLCKITLASSLIHGENPSPSSQNKECLPAICLKQDTQFSQEFWSLHFFPSCTRYQKINLKKIPVTLKYFYSSMKNNYMHSQMRSNSIFGPDESAIHYFRVSIVIGKNNNKVTITM